MDVQTVRVHADASAFDAILGSTTPRSSSLNCKTSRISFNGRSRDHTSSNRVSSGVSTNSCGVQLPSHPLLPRGPELGTGSHSQPINCNPQPRQAEDSSGRASNNARQEDVNLTSYPRLMEQLTSTHNNNPTARTSSTNVHPPLPFDGFPAANDADLNWVPSWDSYVDRASKRMRHMMVGEPVKQNHQPAALPASFPSQIEDASVWDGNDLIKRPESWVIQVSESEVEEIENAVKQIIDSNTTLSDITRDNFPLPTLGPKLDTLGKSLYQDGLGFFVLRGLNPKKYTAVENITGYVGVSSWVGDERGVQDEAGNMLLHLKDLGNTSAPAHLRQAPYSNVEQPYHTDSAEIIALYVLSPASQGGRSKLASSGQIYNHLTTDEIRTLSSPEFVFDRFNECNEVPAPRPLLFAPAEPHSPHPTLAFSRRPLTGSSVSPRSSHLPKLSTKQLDTLDTVHFLAEKFCLKTALQQGDVLYWNNYKIIHGREGFEPTTAPPPVTSAANAPIDSSGRHYVRLWLRKKGGGVSGGVKDLVRELGCYREHGDPPREELWPINPIIDWKHITTRTRTSGHA